MGRQEKTMSEEKNTYPDLIGILNALPEQAEAITSSAALTVISAGAGTGKTQTLSKRFAWLIATDRECRADQILVLTFTEKAAREMQSRIKETMFEWRERIPKDFSANFEASLRMIDEAYISTIHSFAMRVIRESGLVLDLDPKAGIVPAPKEEIWWNDFAAVLGSLIETRLFGLLSDEWRQRAEELFSARDFSYFVSFYTPESIAKAAKNAAETLGSCGKNPNDLWEQSLDPLIEDVEGKKAIYNEIWDIWHDAVFPAVWDLLQSKPDKSFETLGRIALEFSNKEPADEDLQDFANKLLSEGLANIPGNSKQKKAIEDALQCKLTEWRNEKRRELLEATRPSDREARILCLLNRTCAIGWQCWESLRHKEGVLSHSDLIRYAGDVLKRTPDYGAKFRHILVDEFQDTDGLQDNLIRALWKEGTNTLFLVGDLKQSIYRFRHADLTIFRKYIEMAANGSDGRYKYITLSKSFRTRDALIERLNIIFEEIWSDGIEKGTPMKYEPLSTPDSIDWWKHRNEEIIAPVIKTLAFAKRREKDTSQNRENGISIEQTADVRLRLFRDLAFDIADMHERGTMVWDKATKNFRPARWNDIAVLVPARTFYPTIERAFESQGVPYVLCTSKNYFSRGEVSDVINLISLLADPENPLYLAGWLASPFSGVEYGEAQDLILSAAGKRKKNEPMPLAETVRERAPVLWKAILRLKAIAELNGVKDAILEIQKKPAYLRAFDPFQRRRVKANLLSLADLAAEYELSQGRSLAGCADYLQFAVSATQSKEEPDVTDENYDAVNVLTIHAAKGLEYPVVAIVGTERTIRKPSGINISTRYGVVVSKLPEFMLTPEESEVRTVAGAWHTKREMSSATAERERMWYVAATRARDRLLLCGTLLRDETDRKSPPPGERSFLDHILAASESHPGLCEVAYVGQDDLKTFKNSDINNGKEAHVTPMTLKTVHPAKLARISASAYAMLSWCPLAYRMAYRQGLDVRWIVWGDGFANGSEFGSLAHWVLSKWDFKEESICMWLPEAESPAFESAIKKLPLELRDEFKSARVRKELRSMLREYAKSQEGMGLSSLLNNHGHKVQRETPFRVQDGDLLLVGTTDIFWKDTNGFHLRDWKTTAEKAAPQEYYERQLSFYCYALWIFLRKNSAEPVCIDAAINYLKPTGSFKKTILFEDKELEAEGINIHKAAEIALSGDFIKNNKHCNNCPWKEDCIK